MTGLINKNEGKKDAKIIALLFELCKQNQEIAFILSRTGRVKTESFKSNLWRSLGMVFDSTTEQKCYNLIALAIARSQKRSNGKLQLGHAIVLSFDQGLKNNLAERRLRQLLGCENINELSLRLQPMLQLIHKRVKATLDYCALLQELKQFEKNPLQVKISWAQQFYFKNKIDLVQSK